MCRCSTEEGFCGRVGEREEEDKGAGTWWAEETTQRGRGSALTLTNTLSAKEAGLSTSVKAGGPVPMIFQRT